VAHALCSTPVVATPPKSLNNCDPLALVLPDSTARMPLEGGVRVQPPMQDISRPIIPLLEPPQEDGQVDLFRRHPWLLGLRSGALAFAIIGGLTYLIWLSTIRSQEQLKTVFTEDRSDISEVEGLRAVGYDDKGKTWEVFSLKATRMSDTKQNLIEDLQELHIFKDGQINLTGQADRAEYENARKILHLYDNVSLVDREQSTKLLTNHLTWYENTEELRCPTSVDMRIEDNHIIADSLYADRDLIHMEFIGNVRMYLRGVEKPNLLTREGILDPEDAEAPEEDNKDGLWVAAAYVQYDKETRKATCFPYIPANAKRKWKIDEFDFPSQRLNQIDPAAGDILQQQVDSVEEYLNSGEKKAEEIDVLFGPKIPEPLIERRDRQVFAWQKTKRLFSDRLDIDMKAKRLDPRRDVLFFAESLEDRVQSDAKKAAKAIAKETTSLYGEQMRVYWKTGLVEAWDGVEAVQKDKRLTADYIINQDKIGVMQADGHVVIHQASGDWMASAGLLDDVTEEKARTDARKPTTIYCDAAMSYTEPGYLYCVGNVKVVQVEQRAWADIGEYHDTDEWLTLTGHVDYSNSKGEQIDADELKMFMDIERYEIYQGRKVVLEMPEKYARKIDDAKKENE